jgi:hypothetical protein
MEIIIILIKKNTINSLQSFAAWVKAPLTPPSQPPPEGRSPENPESPDSPDYPEKPEFLAHSLLFISLHQLLRQAHYADIH